MLGHLSPTQLRELSLFHKMSTCSSVQPLLWEPYCGWFRCRYLLNTSTKASLHRLLCGLDPCLGLLMLLMVRSTAFELIRLRRGARRGDRRGHRLYANRQWPPTSQASKSLPIGDGILAGPRGQEAMRQRSSQHTHTQSLSRSCTKELAAM